MAGQPLQDLRAFPRKKVDAEMTRKLSFFQILRWGNALFMLCLVLALLSTGCAFRVGPKTVARDRFDYSSAIDTSWKEQMLLNMVRNRYMDPPFFMDVSQVVANYNFGGEVGINAPDWKGNPAGPAAGASGHWTENPTIVYTPLAGDHFVKSLMKPISPSALLFLVQGGWPIDIVFGIAVRSINGLHAGSTILVQKQAPDLSFYLALKMLGELQREQAFSLQVIDKGEHQGTSLIFKPHHPDEETMAKALNVRKLLGLDLTTHEFRLALGAVPFDDKEIAVLTRSMLEILSEAAAGVQIPQSDLDEGRATKRAPLQEFTEALPNFSVHVKSSEKRPSAEEVFTAVSYHGHWFWISDQDLPSKRGLGFLLELFMLAESGTVAPLPTLTISN